jgi:tRNA threonylcarbamoyladenosine biosynthesis protein TsaB
MRLLAVDTATEICGVALATDGDLEAEVVLHHGQTHTRHIIPAIEAVLDQARVSLSAVDAFVVTRGPGSFTGLRIGISTVKGLAMATGKPMVGISTLAVLAHQAQGRSELVCPIIDARRNELYWALYERRKTGLQARMPETVGPAGLIPGHIDAPCFFIGNGVLSYQSHIQEKIDGPSLWASPEQGHIQPAVLARLGLEKLRAGRTDDLLTFGPVYLRKSDAEISRVSD